MKTLLVIDGNSLVHRCFHAVPPLTAPDNLEPTNAIHGMVNILIKALREMHPDYTAVCFDRPEPTYRHQEFAAYKAQRPKAPPELISQLKRARDIVAAMGLGVFEKPGEEADDLIASLTEKARELPDLQVIILTGDLDTLQLVEDPRVRVRTFKKGLTDTITYDEAQVRDRFGVTPIQVPDYKAIAGDPSDNIPGLPQAGPKTATRLLAQFGSIEELAVAIPQDPKLNAAYGQHLDALYLGKRLTLLNRQAIAQVDWSQLKTPDQLPIAAVQLFTKLGFTRILAQIDNRQASKNTGTASKVPPQVIAPAKPQLGTLFNLAKPPSVDLDLVWISGLENPEELKNKFKLPGTKVGFGLQEKLRAVRKGGGDLVGSLADLGVIFWLLDPDRRDYSPQTIFTFYLHRDFRGEEKDLKEIYEFGKLRLEALSMWPSYQQVEMKALPVLAQMEVAGIAADKRELDNLARAVEKQVKLREERIYQLAGTKFNPNSPAQVADILYDRLGLKPSSPTSRSTDFGHLMPLAAQYPIVSELLSYREDFKILTTYALPLASMIGSDGRIHPQLIQTATATGRISSREPNLQNIPQESEWSKSIRRAFVAPPGWQLLALDYSQLELRIIAALSQDPEMVQAFKAGEDIHAVTAARIFNKPLSEITPGERRAAKALNFGLAYGMGARAYAQTSGLNLKEATAAMQHYFDRFRKVRVWQETIKQEARQFGFTTTLSGRRRYFPALSSGAPRLVAEGERAALNHPVQGLEGDILKLAMIAAQDWIENHGQDKVRLILPIHDELLFEVRNDMMETSVSRLVPLMERVLPSLSIPLRVSVSGGENWGSMHALPGPNF